MEICIVVEVRIKGTTNSWKSRIALELSTHLEPLGFNVGLKDTDSKTFVESTTKDVLKTISKDVDIIIDTVQTPRKG